MRIEHVGTAKNIPENARGQVLTHGEILIAEVMGVDGDKVMLKGQDGMALSAKLISDINVSVGDFVETIVDEAGHGRYVLRIVDITRNRPDNNIGGTDTPKVNSDFGAARTLRETLNIMKMNPGTVPKVASFISRHDIGGTPENIEIITQLSKAVTPIGKLLAEVISLIKNGAVKTDNAPALTANAAHVSNKQVENAEFARSANEKKEAILVGETEKIDVRQNTLSAAKNNNISVKTNPEGYGVQTDASDIPDTLSYENAAVSPKENNLTEQPEKETISPPLNQTPINTEDTTVSVATQKGTVSAASDNAGAVIAVKYTDVAAVRRAITSLEPDFVLTTKPYIKTPPVFAERDENDMPAERVLSEKIISLFVKLGDKDKLAANIKKAVTELPENIKELKLLLSRHDTNNKDELAGMLESAEKQLSLLSQIKHFNFFHIPLLRPDGSDTTAELYIYRNRKNRKAEDAESFVILLGLNTQHLGRVETLIKAGGAGLSVVLYMEDTSFAEGDEIKLFKESAKRFGYKTVNVSAEKLVSNTTILNSEERLTFKPGDGFGVDIRI
ncbi:MAG: hypothetical protein WDA65_04245 [Christensenellales bacterium]